MKNRLGFIYLFFWIFSSAIMAMSPQAVLEKIDQNRAPADTFTFRLNVSVQKENDQSHVALFVRVKESKKSLVLYTAPAASKGRVLLLVDDNMWVYIPGTKNAIRISPQQQLMGQVSNADVARVVYSLDYQADSVVNDAIDHAPVLKLTLSAKTKGAAYKSIVLWVKETSYAPIKAEFYALSGRHLKTAYYKKYATIFGKTRPTVLEIHDELQKTNITTLEYTAFTLDTTPDAYFQKTYMERFGASQ